MLKTVTRLTVIICAVNMSGCAAFQQHSLPDLTNTDLAISVETKTKIFSRWDFNSSRSEDIRTASAAIHKQDFEKAVVDSGCCEIVESLADANLVVSGEVTDHYNSAALIPAVITGLSLYTIPSWVTEKLDLTVIAESGTITKNYEFEDSFKLVQWLPMAFAFPFTGGPIKNSEILRTNTYKNLVSQLKEDNLI